MCFCCVREPKNQHQPENATKGRTTQGECNPKLAPAGEPGAFTSRDVGLCLFAAVDLSAGHDNKQYVSDPPTHDSPARVSR